MKKTFYHLNYEEKKDLKEYQELSNEVVDIINDNDINNLNECVYEITNDTDILKLSKIIYKMYLLA